MMIECLYGGTGKIIVQGHRGALGHAPENTMPSFELGYSMGSDVLELDVHVSKDKQLVVMHDPDVSRTTDGNGRIKDLTVQQLKKLNAAAKFNGFQTKAEIPLLAEVLAWAKGKIDVVVEIKGDPFPADGIEKMLVQEIDRHAMLDHVLVISFYHDSVRKIRELSGMPAGILYTGRPVDPVTMTKQADAQSFRCDWKYLSKEDTTKAHDAGLWVSCWGADTEELFERMAAIGVDSMGCNYPDRLRSWLDQRGLGIGNRRTVQ